MVVGSGLIGNVFYDEFHANSAIIVFASGVSDSTCTDAKAFKREFDMLRATFNKSPKSLLLYFSTLSIADESVKERPYILHKLEMEAYIKQNIPNYLILRVSNVVGFKGNPKTIINHIYNSILNRKPLKVWEYAERNIIDVDDVNYIVKSLIKRQVVNQTINIASATSLSVKTIVATIEGHLKMQAQANYLEIGNPLVINTANIQDELGVIHQQKGKGHLYLKYVLNKYYN